MLEFYEFNTMNICIVLISIFIIYNLINRFTNTDKNNKNLNIDNLIISTVLAFMLSLIFSYFITENDEKLLSENYWDPIIET